MKLRQTNPNVAREAAISQHLADSVEMAEFVLMIVRLPILPGVEAGVMGKARLLTAVALGMEVGYELGLREGERK